MNGALRSGLGARWLLVLLPYALLAWRFEWVCDDAYISFRYSRNLAEGLGLVYNPGRDVPVEGYSNFLWVLWLAVFERLGLDVPLAARWSSALCGALLVVLVARSARQSLGLSRAGTQATALFLGTLPPVAVWATGGLAAMPMALLVTLVYERLLADAERPRGVQAGLFAVLVVLIRADGIAWVAMLGAAAFLAWLHERRPRRLALAAAQTVGLAALAFAVHVAWRLSYYGDWLPNTARVKAGFTWDRLARGLDYVAAWGLILPSVLLVLASGLRRWRAGTSRIWLPAWTVILGTLAYAVWVGGDFMPFGRFVFPAIPFVGLVFAATWQRLDRPDDGNTRRGRKAALSFGTLCIALSIATCFELDLVPGGVRARFHFRADRQWKGEVAQWREMRDNRELMEELGHALAQHTRPGESIILGGIGATGYYSRLFVYDKYGLVTPEVVRAGKVRPDASPGHDLRVQEEFFFGERPTYWGALVAPADTPLEWRLPGPSDPWRRVAHVEQLPLADAPGKVLRVIRFDW